MLEAVTTQERVGGVSLKTGGGKKDAKRREELSVGKQDRHIFLLVKELSLSARMRSVFSTTVVLLVALTITAEAVKRKDKGKVDTECSDWVYGRCVPNTGDCGLGVREATCNGESKKHKCKVPCNWKKDFGADCKYKFGRWAECDTSTGTRSRMGTLKKAMFNADCQSTIKVSKPCTPKPVKVKGPERKVKKGKEN